MTEETKTPETTEETPKAAAPAAPAADKSAAPTKNEGRRPRRGGRRNDRRKEPKEFEESIIQIDRVTRVTKGGRQMRFRVSVVIGDGKGRVGFGIGKSGEVMVGVQKAVAVAKKNLINVPIFEDSIPHQIIGRFKSSQVLLFPAPEGKGVIAGGAVRKIMELAGGKNVLSKMHGSRNRVNAAKATMAALQGLKNTAPHKVKSAEAEEAKTEEAPKKAPAKKPAAKKATKKTTKKD